MITVGVTGSFGTGKTFVARCFGKLGARVLDADAIAHRALKRGSPEYKKVVVEFGPGVINSRKEIERGRLAALVFNDKKKMRRLVKIVHPAVIGDIKKKIRRAAKDAIIVIDAPLLIEAGLHSIVDAVVVVTAPEKLQLLRCRKKFRLSRRDIQKRIRSQMPLARKIALADFVIDNSGSKQETRRQMRKTWKKIAAFR